MICGTATLVIVALEMTIATASAMKASPAHRARLSPRAVSGDLVALTPAASSKSNTKCP